MSKATLLNFRCPDELWERIAAIGNTYHPVSGADKHHRSTRDYDLTSTMLDIVHAGVSVIEGDPFLLHRAKGTALDRTDVEAMIQSAIAKLTKDVEELKRANAVHGYG